MGIAGDAHHLGNVLQQVVGQTATPCNLKAKHNKWKKGSFKIMNIEPSSETKQTSGFIQTFKSLSDPNFRTLWLGMFFTVASMQINVVTRSWIAYDLSGSALMLGVVAIARGLPQIILSPIGGVIADRFDKRKVLMIAQSILLVLALFNAILVHTNLIQIWHLVVIGIFQGAVFPFTMPTRQALIPLLVGKDNLPNALAMDSAGRNLNRVLAPSMAGVLITWCPTIAFYTVAAFYLISILTMTKLPSVKATVDSTQNPMQQMLYGFSYIIENRRLLIFIGMGFLAVTLGMPYQQMLAFFQDDVLHAGPEVLGFMYTAVGVGALFGSLFVVYRSGDPRRQGYQLIAGVCFGALLIPFALSGNLVFSLTCLVLIGFSNEVFMTVNHMMVILNTDEHLYGRVMGTYGMTLSLMPIATLPMGYFVDKIGGSTIAGAGFLLAVTVLILSSIRIQGANSGGVLKYVP
ncbi:MFS transporter [Desulfobacter curvatus]|uniref:MFS transporter n=1 Tax=Desulfobacter curvatus TaxID=2290 RepID=UPI00037810BE|nr:MFS transporter [Desulfobacter curvatus]